MELELEGQEKSTLQMHLCDLHLEKSKVLISFEFTQATFLNSYSGAPCPANRK